MSHHLYTTTPVRTQKMLEFPVKVSDFYDNAGMQLQTAGSLCKPSDFSCKKPCMAIARISGETSGKVAHSQPHHVCNLTVDVI